MIEQERTFYVNGVPVTWHEIYAWWEKLRYTNKDKAQQIGDPFWSESACWFIAKEIVGEMEVKIHGKRSKTYDTPDEKKEKKENEVPEIKNSLVYYNDDLRGVDCLDQTAVFKKALEDAEKKYKEKIKAEEDKRQQQQYEYFRHQQAKNKTNAPPPPKPKEIDWRDVLGISYGISVTEDMIKKNFRIKAMVCHPDMGGTNEKMDELFRARDAAYKAIGLNPP